MQDLLAPGGAAVFLPRARPLIDRLVLDAHVAKARPEFAEAANSAGVSVLVDPLTPFWQGQLREEDRWARLPFGRAQKLDARDLSNSFNRETLVAQVVDFQIERGATAIIPPYPYVGSPADPFFDVALDFLRSTARYMSSNGLALPLVPVLCVQLLGFGTDRVWSTGIDRFASAALDLGPEGIALCLSPAGAGNDSYNKVLRLFMAARRIRRTGARVIAWRQGIYGPGLVAAGLDGYETGIGTRELCNVASSIASRKPPKPGQKPGGGGVPGIYLEPLHRSVSSRVGETLLGHRSMRPKLMCDDDRCCPNGVASTLDQRRQHAIRTRARELAALEGQPHESWRLHQIAKDARAASDLATQANDVLRQASIPERIGTTGYESLARVAEFIRESASDEAAAGLA
ncbi:MAG TPA: hypothetical protein VG294_07525 [Solirubrobacteraceae bacterium]|jgi:hypothetical protein|nr:hypothetical protein [Solirubrobacteraceae bacterium]